ncbi:integrase core domain-containing protein, partial [Ruegeria pomeroyi]|nr:integrase core domain-containing protein [Ruegeria pomeroyi]
MTYQTLLNRVENGVGLITLNRPEAREKITFWKEDYNRQRPHSSLGNLT